MKHEHEHEHHHEREHDHEHHHEREHDHCHEHGECACCGCGHDRDHEKAPKNAVLLYILGAIPIIIGFLSFIPFYIPLVAAIVGYLIFGISVWREMLEGFARKKIFTEFTLMCVATACAFAIGEYADAAALMYLYSLGETISGGAYTRSKRSIEQLMEISPEFATVVRGGEAIRVAPDTVEVGESILVRAGERMPLDSVAVSGGAYADTSSVTGESKPTELYEGVECPSGALITDGSVTMRVLREYQSSVVWRMSEAVKKAAKNKSQAEKKITRFAAVFTPIAFGAALCVFAVGALITGEVAAWLKTGIVVLVVSCPCSLVLSVPLTYFAAMGSAARQGIIFRGGEVMDRCAKLHTVAFDKTGTLTDAALTFDAVHLYSDMPEERFLQLAGAVLTHSPHVAAVSFCKVHGTDSPLSVSDVQNVSGRGVVCTVNGKVALFGNARLLSERGIEVGECESTCIFGAYDGVLVGRLDFSSHVKAGAGESVKKMKALGVLRVSVISGDVPRAVESTCKELGIDEFYGGVAPDGKLEIFEAMAADVPKGKFSAYCGDGLNDSAVIQRADVGMAMGRGGSALTVENADIVLMDDDLDKINTAIRISRRASRVASSNIALSLGIKAAVTAAGIVLATLGADIPMGLAIVADVGAAVVAVLNSLRAAKEVK